MGDRSDGVAPGSPQVALVGRGDALATLARALERLDEGGCALEIAGEPGIGKTRLLTELADRAERGGHLVLSGRAIELERDLPFGPLVDALETHLRERGEHPLGRLSAEDRDELAHVFPALPGGARVEVAAPVTERYRAHRAIGSLLDSLAREKPLVLCLDDLHWADDASVEAIEYLLRRPPRGPVLIALAFRPRQVSDRLVAALAAAAREGTGLQLDLGPLTREEADPMLAPLEGAARRDALFRESGGNPFYLEELLRAGPRAVPVPAADRSLPEADVPAAVSAALAAELDELSPAGLALLRGASVLGDPFEPELAALVAEIGGGEWPRALDELTESDLVRPAEASRRLRFRHPLVRRATYRSIPTGWRLAAHARAARTLASRGVSVLGLAPHVESSAATGDQEAIQVLAEAGRAAESRAPAAAAHWYGAAIELLPRDDERRLELLIAKATSLGSAGKLHEGREALIEALALLPAGAGMERVRLVAFLAGIEHQLGRFEEAQARNLAAHAEVETTGSPESVALLIELASHGAYTAEDWPAACRWGERALEEARALGEPALIASAAAILCVVETNIGRTAAANRHRLEAASVIDELGEEQVAGRLDAPMHLAFSELLLEHYEAAADHFARGVEVARSAGQGQFIPTMRSGYAWTLSALGRLAQAESSADAGVEAARLQGSPQGLAWALWAKAWAQFMAGDLSGALRSGEESVSLCAELEPTSVTTAAHAHLAAICAEAGLPERALEELDAAGAPEFPTFEPGRRPIWAEVEVIALLELGRRDEASAWADRAITLVGDRDLPVAAGIAKRARARVLLDRGDAEAAAESAHAAAGDQARRGARVEAARSRLLAGQALVAVDRERAAAELERAMGEFVACGSQNWAAATRRELRDLGRRVPAGVGRANGGSGIGALSAREREIADLVVEGLTNREVAERLFISQKTVESHLARVFEKLDVSKRIQVGAAIERAARERDEHR